jgi:hypothetical protein
VEAQAGSVAYGVASEQGKGGEMNERIKALIKDVGLCGYGEESGAYMIPTPAFESRIERLAELIIEDCVACCAVVAQAAINARDSDNYWNGREDAARLCKVAIQKHFGEGK